MSGKWGSSSWLWNPWQAGVFLAGALMLATIEVSLILDGPVEAPGVRCLSPVLGLLYSTAGFVLSGRRPSNRTGSLLIFGGLAWFASGLAAVAVPPLTAIGLVLDNLPVAVTLHLLFVFPSGRTASTLDRVAVGAIYFAALVFQMPAYLFGDDPAPFDLLRIEQNDGLADMGANLRALVAWMVSLAVIVSLFRRYRGSRPEQRRAFVPFMAYATAALFVIPMVSDLLGMFAGLSDSTVRAFQLIVLAGIPVAAVTTMLRGGFARISAIQELAARIGHDRRARDLEQTLGAALGDPTARIAFRVVDGELIGPDGSPFDQSAEDASRGVCELMLGDRSIGVITYDPSLVSAAEVESAASVMAVWIERNRLSAALRVSEEALRSSHRQIMETADQERRRIAQDLHDGLASHLVLLAIKVQQVAGDGRPDPELRRRIGDLQRDLEQAIADLRGLVHRVMPAGLVDRGLVAGIEDLLDEAPFETRLEAPEGFERPPEEIERAAYFIVAEAVNNATRHSGASRLAVEIGRTGDRLVLRVTDDGVGDARPGAGAGLTGMAERAASYGGGVELQSPEGRGTAVTVTLPLAGEGEPGEREWAPGSSGGAVDLSPGAEPDQASRWRITANTRR